MRCYASNTRTKRNLEQFRKHHWRVLLSPLNPEWPQGLHCAIDNGAWSCFQSKLPFDGDGFMRLVEKHGAAADWTVIPDKVAGGLESLEFSESCYPRQAIGVFLGGSTEWKLRTMYGWGMVAHCLNAYYHVARVNSARRIRLAQEAGADSIDGAANENVTLWKDGEIIAEYHPQENDAA